MRTTDLNRRHLLNAMGLGASTLFLPSLVGDKIAYAQGVPKKLLVFYTPHGPVNQRWTMRSNGPAQWNGANKSDRSLETSFPLGNLAEASWSDILKPLYPNRAKILAMEGLAMTSVFADTVKNAHNAGTAHALTASKQILNSGPFSQGGAGDSSIDQIVADAIADKSRVRNLFFTTGGWSPIYRGTTEQTGISDPIKAYDRLFPGGSTGVPLFDRVRQRRTNLLDAVRAEYDLVYKKLGGEDKAKLQSHFDMVNEIQKSLLYRANEGGKCASKPARFVDAGTEPERTAKFGELITAAFSCDMTRVATIAMGTMGVQESASVVDIHDDLHLAVAHEATPDNPRRADEMTRYYAYFAKTFSNLMTQLDAVKVDGNKSVLDNTVCLWLCELANGPHEFHDIMAVIGGSGGGHFNTGRYIKYAENNTRGNTKYGPAHSKLLVSVAQAMGLDRNSIGMASGSVGGAAADLAGPLPMLKA